ncbi:glycosyl transferase family 2 [Bacteroidia bacterium]|nr:glycosyl transferase family 2 [Bacteroidia bacterium]GHT50937.1 glycosyl transferase family 2 [Bacteroidia bacterium]
MKKKTSIIITTYNSPDALRIVLQSLLLQSVMPAEIIIADDGSTSETQDLVKEFVPLFPIPVRHCWQEDAGFRLSASRNKAIAMSTADYIIMVDGDMVLHKNFIRDHIRTAKTGKFVQGPRAKVSEQLTRQIFSLQRLPVLHCLSKGVKKRFNACRCRPLSILYSALFSKQTHALVRGCNMAFWRKDVIAINGFNEAFVGWGREDNEFAARMLNSGIKRNNLRLGGVAYHLHHKENSRPTLDVNDRLLEQTVSGHLAYCSLGINQYL